MAIHRRVAAALLALLILPTQAATLRWAGQRDPLGMDPHRQLAGNAGFLVNLYEGLVRRDAQLRLEPALAQRWEPLPDGRGWRFFLRQGVSFHNGQAFDAEDVLYSFQRAQASSPTLETLLKSVARVEVVDNHTVDLLTHRPNPILPQELSLWFLVDREWGEAMDHATAMGGQTPATHLANGTGPFLLEHYQPGTHIQLLANPNWWDTPTHDLHQVEFRPIPDPAVRTAALLDGEVDLITPVALEDLRNLQVLGDLRIVQGGDLRVILLGFNHAAKGLHHGPRDHNPLADARVRRALALALDLEALNRETMAGMAIPTGTVMASAVNGFSPRLARPGSVDKAAARELLSEAGVESLRLALLCPDNLFLNDAALCQALVPMLEAVGVSLTLEILAPADYARRLREGSFDLYLAGPRPTSFDGEEALRFLLRTPEPGNPGLWNFGAYSDPDTDRLIDLAGQEMDPENRSELLFQGLSRIREEMLYIPLLQLPDVWAVRDGIQLTHRADAAVCLRWVTVNAQ